jgi:RHS repeat-associated protein
VFLNVRDQLGSTAATIDLGTGELVQSSTSMAYGAQDSSYRPTRWESFREDYRFTGKEDDIELGLVYFGKRYYAPMLGRWISADPLAVHVPGRADLNVYAYVHGMPLAAVDPVGLNPILIGAAIGAGVNIAQQLMRQDGFDLKSLAASTIAGAVGGYVGAGMSAYSASWLQSPFWGTAVGSSFGGAAAGSSGYLLHAFLSGERVRGADLWSATWQAGAIGAASGAISHWIATAAAPGVDEYSSYTIEDAGDGAYASEEEAMKARLRAYAEPTRTSGIEFGHGTGVGASGTFSNTRASVTGKALTCEDMMCTKAEVQPHMSASPGEARNVTAWGHSHPPGGQPGVSMEDAGLIETGLGTPRLEGSGGVKYYPGIRRIYA